MKESMASTWRTLHLPGAALPSLLIKASLGSSGYTVHLTDLSRVWGETVTKRDVRKRADRNDCVIDPSDGDDQYRILQSKIEDALGQVHGTAISLRSAPDIEDGVVLKLSAPLQSPLPPFKWEIYLAPLPGHYVEAELVTPLLHQAQKQQAQIRALIHELHDKDRVISKITDKLETSGYDLATIFPGASNVKVKRNQPLREQFAKHVSGLGDFDVDAWEKRVHGDSSMNAEGKLEDGALDEVLKGLPGAVMQIGKDEVAGQWWRELGEGVSSDGVVRSAKKTVGKDVRHDSQRSIRTPGASSDTVTPKDVDIQDEQADDFQRQGTPPQLRHRDHHELELEHEETQRIPSSITQEREPLTVAGDDSTTEDDDDDLDAPPRKPAGSQHSGSRAPQTKQRGESPGSQENRPGVPGPTPKKLGAMGGREKRRSSSLVEEQLSEVEMSPPKPTRAKLGTLGAKAKAKASMTPGPAFDAAEASPVELRAKLGTIGGRGKAKASATPDATPTDAPKSSATSPVKHHKLGIIGGKKQVTSTLHRSSHQTSEESSTRGSTREPSPQRSSRQPERKSTTSPVRETSQDRADRKRNELKRQLEAKAHAPAKKKRKF